MKHIFASPEFLGVFKNLLVLLNQLKPMQKPMSIDSYTDIGKLVLPIDELNLAVAILSQFYR